MPTGGEIVGRAPGLVVLKPRQKKRCDLHGQKLWWPSSGPFDHALFRVRCAMFGRLDSQAVVRLLNELDRRDAKRELFGSIGHRYKLRPPLPASVIDAFEKKHGLALPQDYRYFITEIGDGGAGPYYGVFPFGQHDDGHGHCAWDHGRLIGDLSKPFAHVTGWNLPRSFWDDRPEPSPDMPLEEEDRLMQAWDSELDEKYWNPSLMNGAIPICHLGCAQRQWLVVNGEQRGYVWSDDRADEKGLYPIRDDSGDQMTFSGWFTSWLFDALQKAASASIDK